jgi:hypothetical protein
MFRASLLIILLASCCCIAQAQAATVVVDRAALREIPSSDEKAKEEIPAGTKIKILDQKEDWYIVRIGDRVGWMHGVTFKYDADLSLVRPVEGQSIPSTPSSPRRIGSTGTASSGSTDTSGELIRGPKGGCYRISKNGKKVYVDRSRCN